MDKTNINALVQSIERSLHLIYKNIFSIKQYQFPPKKLARICLKNHADFFSRSLFCLYCFLVCQVYDNKIMKKILEDLVLVSCFLCVLDIDCHTAGFAMH